MESNLLELSGAVCCDAALPGHCTTVTWECSLTVTSQQTKKKKITLHFSVGPLLLQDFPTSNQTGAAATIVRLQGSCGASLSAQVRNPVLWTIKSDICRQKNIKLSCNPNVMGQKWIFLFYFGLL